MPDKNEEPGCFQVFLVIALALALVYAAWLLSEKLEIQRRDSDSRIERLEHRTEKLENQKK